MTNMSSQTRKNGAQRAQHIFGCGQTLPVGLDQARPYQTDPCGVEVCAGVLTDQTRLGSRRTPVGCDHFLPKGQNYYPRDYRPRYVTTEDSQVASNEVGE